MLQENGELAGTYYCSIEFVILPVRLLKINSQQALGISNFIKIFCNALDSQIVTLNPNFSLLNPPFSKHSLCFTPNNFPFNKLHKIANFVQNAVIVMAEFINN